MAWIALGQHVHINAHPRDLSTGTRLGEAIAVHSRRRTSCAVSRPLQCELAREDSELAPVSRAAIHHAAIAGARAEVREVR